MADSSRTIASAILMQRGDDENSPCHVIAYASRKLLPRATRYPVIELELLAIIFALNKFHHHMYDMPTTVLNNHRSLQWLNSLVKHSSRLARWALILQEYDITTQYIRGEHQLPDCFIGLPAVTQTTVGISKLRHEEMCENMCTYRLIRQTV